MQHSGLFLTEHVSLQPSGWHACALSGNLIVVVHLPVFVVVHFPVHFSRSRVHAAMLVANRSRH